MDAKKSRKSLNPVNPDCDNSHKKGTFFMQKHCTRLEIVVLITMLAVAISSCDEQMTPQMDPIIDAVMEDPQPPPPVTPPPVTTQPVTPPSSTEGMVLIPAGEFQMGSNFNPDEKPIHSVYIDAFYMDEYEVTNAEYAAFLNAKGKHTESGKTWLHIGSAPARIEYVAGVYRAKGGYENHPVIYVSWHGAVAYSKWKGKRLPTEAEWEKAARGNLSGLTYPWGNTIDSSKANYDSHIGDTTAVGKYTANGYGLYDMAGNVWEWCLDGYDSGFYAVSPRQNPLSGANSIMWILDNYIGVNSIRVLRGGSWHNTAQNVRVAARFTAPTSANDLSGFRCVRDTVTP